MVHLGGDFYLGIGWNEFGGNFHAIDNLDARGGNGTVQDKELREKR